MLLTSHFISNSRFRTNLIFLELFWNKLYLNILYSVVYAFYHFFQYFVCPFFKKITYKLLRIEVFIHPSSMVLWMLMALDILTNMRWIDMISCTKVHGSQMNLITFNQSILFWYICHLKNHTRYNVIPTPKNLQNEWHPMILICT